MTKQESEPTNYDPSSLWIEVDDGPEEHEPLSELVQTIITTTDNWMEERSDQTVVADSLAQDLVEFISKQVNENTPIEDIVLISTYVGSRLDYLKLSREDASRKVFDFINTNFPAIDVGRNINPYHVSIPLGPGYGVTVYFDEQGQFEMGMGTGEDFEEDEPVL